jgi:anti-sigma B factor antagonist
LLSADIRTAGGTGKEIEKFMAPQAMFLFEVEESEDENKLPVTTVKCKGKMLRDSGLKVKNLVKPLIEAGGRHIIIDLSELESLDSSGLGVLVGLKVTAANKGPSRVDIINLSPRISELLKITNLTELFAN